jgi:hypothetical protein
MKRTVLFLVLAALSCSDALASKGEPKLLLVNTQSRIEVDAEGNVTSIRTTPQLPAEIQAFVEGNLRKLRFQAPMKDGHPVAGVTYAAQDACAAPVGDSYRFAVKFRGIGPGYDSRVQPFYPMEAQRRGVESTWDVEYEISPDGKAHAVKFLRTKGSAKGHLDEIFRTAIDQWLKASPFQPEIVDGQPVATRVSNTVDFTLSSAPSAAREKERAANDACQLALDARDTDPRAVALDSPFRLVADHAAE